ncbi:MAG: PIN domain-containing protein [Candidatus Binatus sp.]|uniref:PIN domain-containing protein n=1 Tax=Candidatus Binatus sp. TaxID=2811406 RepID=UPI0027247471|nr:PIN domain-containing protein [Candidatus Binatus sp.]MDO8434549.1 PIN domain-containing protein [Candidatus Binatus sp.]
MATLIDSSVFIDAERGNLSFEDMLAQLADEEVALSAVTASELLYGWHQARNAAQRTRRSAYVEGLLARLPTVPFDLTIARVHSALTAGLDRTRRRVGAHDAMIAATALALDYRVATRDLRSFPRIPGLKTLLL